LSKNKSNNGQNTLNMKLRIINIRYILFTTLLILSFQYNIYSQGNDIRFTKKSGLFIGLSLGPTQSQIINKGTLSVSGLLISKKSAFSGFLEIGYLFSNYLGLSSGIGYSSYNTQLSISSYQNKFNSTDSENELYERRVSGSNISEIQKISSLGIPFCINFRLPVNKTIGFLLQAGVNLAIPLNKNYSSHGTFSYKGYYSAYNALLENIPEYGFPDNLSSTTAGNLKLKSLIFEGIASTGFDVSIMGKLKVSLTACYDKSFSSISAYSLPDKFQLSSDAGKINSIMGGTSKTIIQSLGLRLTFRYYIK